MRTRLVHALFVAVALIMILGAYILDSRTTDESATAEVLQDLGVVVLSVSLLNELWTYAGGDPIASRLEALEQRSELDMGARSLGLRRIYHRGTDISTQDWLNEIDRSEESIDISSHTVSQLFEERALWDSIKRKIESGVNVRILINHEDNPAIGPSGTSSATYVDARKGLMRTAWEELAAERDSFSPEAQKRLTVGRLTSETMFVSIRRFDDRVFVGQYLFTEKMRNNPSLFVQGPDSALFDLYMAEFEGLLARSDKKLGGRKRDSARGSGMMEPDADQEEPSE